MELVIVLDMHIAYGVYNTIIGSLCFACISQMVIEDGWAGRGLTTLPHNKTTCYSKSREANKVVGYEGIGPTPRRTHPRQKCLWHARPSLKTVLECEKMNIQNN
jgi:hypothetical protein